LDFRTLDFFIDWPSRSTEAGSLRQRVGNARVPAAGVARNDQTAYVAPAAVSAARPAAVAPKRAPEAGNGPLGRSGAPVGACVPPRVMRRYLAVGVLLDELEKLPAKAAHVNIGGEFSDFNR
jgi:hypothetical protein